MTTPLSTRLLLVATSLALALGLAPAAALAHPGNTDSSGCHTCRTNCPSWGLSYGEYHCHNSKGVEQPSDPIHSVYGSGGTGYTVPAPEYAATPSCPLMSSYNSLSGSCQCYSGYIVKKDFLGKDTCTNADSYCHDEYGYHSDYNTLSKTCECDYGYVLNGGKCVTEDEVCQDALGYGSRHNTLTDKCECKTGYYFDGSRCAYGDGCPDNASSNGAGQCRCDSGYEVNSDKTACVRIQCPSNSLLIGNSCYCNAGYLKDDNGLCQPKPLDCGYGSVEIGGACVTRDSICEAQYGSNVSGKPDAAGTGTSCYCDAGYVWSGDKCVRPTTYATAKNDVTIRQSTSLNATKVGLAKKGAKYQITDASNKTWVKIKFGQKEGWVMRKNVTVK